jgi:hypothetical protein
MTHGSTPYIPSHEEDTRAQNEFDIWACAQQSQKVVNGSERRRQIGVEESHDCRILGDRRHDSNADRLGFPVILWTADHGDGRGRCSAHALQ